MNSIAWSAAACACAKGFGLSLNRDVTRRQIFRAAGVGFVASLTATLIDAGRVAEAQAISRATPVVDRLAVTFITDNYTDKYRVAAKIPGVQVEWPGGTEKPNIPPATTLEAEWGLAMLAESSLGADTRRVMIDFGYSPGVLLNNMRFLGIDPARFDALVLSHGHYDHFGGLVGLLAAAKNKFKPGLPLFVGGEDCFCARQVGQSGADYGVLDRPAILASGVRLVSAEAPATAADHAIISGQIPLRSSEKPLKATSERTGLAGGLGCDPALEPAAKNTGTYIPDDFQHEIATSYVLRDRGLVVLTSCSHRGVLNTIKQAMAASGVSKLHAVVGGFHLAPPLTDDYVQQTVAEIKAMTPDVLVSAHCSGERFYDMARAEMPGKVMRANVGARVTFGT